MAYNKDQDRYDEWQSFQTLRTEAKTIGKQIFNI